MEYCARAGLGLGLGWSGMADEGVRTLYAPRESTTVWRKADEPETTVVATRKQLDPSGTALVVPTRDYASTSGVLDPPRYAQSGMVQVQIVKHNGAYVPLVDGLIPPHEVVDGETIHLINHHRGMYEDEETQTWVFSPCAVSVCIEDGQALPERCAVAVWQRVAERGAMRLTGHNEVKLGERELRAFRVSDTTASVVYAPFPMLYSRPPRIIVNDMTSILRLRKRGMQKTMWTFLTQYGPLVLSLLRTLGGDAASAQVLANQARAARLTEDAARAADPNTVWGSGMFTMLNGLYQTVLGSDSAADAGTTTGGQLSSLGTSVTAGLIGVYSMMMGVPGARAGIDVMGDRIATSIAVSNPDTATTWTDAFTRTATGVGKALKNENNWLYAGIAAVTDAVNSRPQPLPAKRHFTIGEFATILESLTALVSLDAPNLKGATTNEKFASEAVVVQWLLAAEPGESALFAERAFSLRGVVNQLDMSEFASQQANGIQTDLCVEVEDGESKEACNGRPNQRFRFSTTRSDKRHLGYAAAGTMHDLKRLQTAIDEFDAMLQEQAKREADYGVRERVWTWFDRWIFDPIFSAFRARFKLLQTQSDANNSDAQAELLRQLGVQRRTVLKHIRTSLQKKLHSRFTTPHSEGATLLARLTRAVEERFLSLDPSTKQPTSSPLYVRELPQKMQQPMFLFPPSADADSNYVDVKSDVGTMREFSPFHDAAKVGARAARAASSAIVRAHRSWETEGLRCIFVHAYSDGIGNWAAQVDTYALLANRESYSLVLQLPGDIRDAEASAQLDEESEKRILTLCHKGVAAEEASTLLAHSKLPDTEAALVAMSLFAELWTDELLKLHELSEPTSPVVSAMQTAQVRAARRCVACGTFLEAVTVQSWSGLVPLSESAKADPALLATQAGRDAARLARRLQLVAQPKTSKGVLSKAIVRRLRAIGATLVATGNRLAVKPDTDVLPSEPLQSLFMNPVHGLHAYARATALPNLDARVATAIAAAYPSSLLLLDGALDVAVNGLVRTDAVPRRPPVQVDAARIVQRRMATLRFDYPDTVHLDGATKALHASDNALVEAMSSLSVASGARALAFYVPYGYGQAPPRLVYPPVPAPMFGSVPVWTEDVLASIDAFSTALGAPGSTGAALTTASICPVFPCGGAPQRPLPAHPSLLDVRIGAARRSPKDVLFGVDVCFWASEPELSRRVDQSSSSAPARANEAANQHLQGAYERKLASRVSTLAWNAERILQSLLLLAGGGVVDDDAALYAQLVLSDGDARVSVPVRAESDDIVQAKLERELEEANRVAERDANWHFAELRRTMDMIESYLNGEEFIKYAELTPEERVLHQTPFIGLAVADVDMAQATLTGDGGMGTVESVTTTGAGIPGEPDAAEDNRTKTVLTALSSFSSIGLGVQYLLSTYGAAAMAYIPPEVWTVGYMLGASSLAIGAAGFAATQSQRLIVRAELKRARDEKRLPGYNQDNAASADKTVSAGCRLPFLRYGETDALWNEWAAPGVTVEAMRAFLEREIDEYGMPLQLDVAGKVVGGGTTYADGLKQELERLRSAAVTSIDDLIQKDPSTGGDCPQPEEPLWEQWINQGERITARALKVFLSDENSKWNLEPKAKASGNGSQSSESVPNPNPNSEQRQAALDAIQNRVNTLYGDNAGDGAAGVNLVYYQEQAAMSLYRRNTKKIELEAFVAGSAERAEQREQVRRSVRMHTLVAGIVGNALARGVLGDEAPQVRTLAGPDALQLVGEDYEHAKQVLDKLRSVLAPAMGTNAPDALRLGELCAIVQSVLVT